MNDDGVTRWSREIRDYLLGRLANPHDSLPLDRSHDQDLRHPPIRRWWTFEGRRFPAIGGTIATCWPALLRSAALLDRTFNPRTRLTDRPDGDVDWAATFARGPLGPLPEYVVRSSGVGLNETEHAALRGWTVWLAREWREYAPRFGLVAPLGIEEMLAAIAATDTPPASPEQLRRWTHATRRSRWPILRNVVAETLRPTFEPAALDSIPLPADRPTVFELVCLVRIAARVAGRPDELRWLDLELAHNTLELPGVTCWYQQGLGRATVLGCPDYGHGLAEAADVFGLRVPTQVDIAFEFEEPRNGIDGILVEAKSGGQGFNDTVAQLRVYRQARGRRAGARFLVWGITERSPEGTPSAEQLDWIRRAVREGTDDAWVFSDVDAVGAVMESAGLDYSNRPESQPTPRATCSSGRIRA